jgi:hypothetical protein
MNGLTPIGLLNAAAYALIVERCRRAHIHDVRGGLQSLHGAIDLLTRAASGAVPNPGLAERSTALAHRAMASHEKLLTDWAALVPDGPEAATAVDLGELIGEITRFLQNDASFRSVSLQVTAAKGLSVAVPPRRCRLYLLGLCALALDEMPPATVAQFTVAAAGSQVLFEFKSAPPRAAILDPGELWDTVEEPRQGIMPTGFDLLLSLSAHWLAESGGRAEWEGTQTTPALRLYFPAG